ncbi:hypothetical protein KP509_31G047400 [Ceratopteris richardii]|uniref:Complex 1 LYR protein domain-containing protein n=1 Tax=Ceratopteris richardii TaxID=49495 RepID=A0A8T2QYD5_CERRI|nr:hypothetical protein KP509_31G047400 [Ceratopteris richardii]KAH7288867.1 hypothetical protein KP509_31G047400 [Ceratopteris richardii]
MTAASPSAAEVKALFRAFLREARKFPDYNIREYVKRRSRQGFHQNQNIVPELATAAFAEGRELLEVAKRQAVVYSLYAPKVKNIMELKHVEKQ